MMLWPMNSKRKGWIWMSISTKILNEIDNLPISKDEKKLMEDILGIEDNGSNRFSKDYDELIEKYIKSKGDDNV